VLAVNAFYVGLRGSGFATRRARLPAGRIDVEIDMDQVLPNISKMRRRTALTNRHVTSFASRPEGRGSLQFTFEVYLYSTTPRVPLHRVTLDAVDLPAALVRGRRLLAEWRRYGIVNVAILNANGETLANLNNAADD
jgi:hypothetical protein